MEEPAYVHAPEGVRFRDTQGRLGPTLQDDLALMYDRVEGVVLKHGGNEAVQVSFRRFVEALGGTTLAKDIQVLTIPLGQLTPALLEEINRALQVSGYIGQLARRLAPETGEREERPE
jgi:hypothetical protein